MRGASTAEDAKADTVSPDNPARAIIELTRMLTMLCKGPASFQ